MLNPDGRSSVPDRFHVSPANFWPETSESWDFPAKVHILDSTIRKTYFTAGNATTMAGFVRIAEALVELGVRTTCLNVNWFDGADPTPQDWELLTTIMNAGLPLEVNVWADALLGDGRSAGGARGRDVLHRLVDAGVRTIAPGIVPAPDTDAEKRQADELAALLDEARAMGVRTTITLAGVGLRDVDQLTRACRLAIAHGAARLDLMDSTSSFSPEATRAFVHRFRAGVGDAVPVTMHAHDEFGLATANAIAATSAGGHPDVAVNGMSYRCGFAALEQVALALEVLYGVDTELNLDRLAHVSRVVARESRLPVPPLRPLTGSYAHLKHMPRDAAAAIRFGGGAFPPISHGIVPSVMGADVSWIWGRFSSDDMTRALAEASGLVLDDAELLEVRGRLDAAVAAKPDYPRWLDAEEARSLLVRTVAVLRGEPAPETVGEVVRRSVPAPPVARRVRDRLVRVGVSMNRVVGGPDGVSADSIADAVRGAMGELSVPELIEMLDYFKRFDGEPSKALVPESEREEAAITESAAADRRLLADAAVAYREHFGFPPVVRAQGRAAVEVATILDAAREGTPVAELARTRADVTEILVTRVRWAAGLA